MFDRCKAVAGLCLLWVDKSANRSLMVIGCAVQFSSDSVNWCVQSAKGLAKLVWREPM